MISTDRGYRSHNHGVCKGDFTWANYGDKLLLAAFYELYFDVLKPYVDGP